MNYQEKRNFVFGAIIILVICFLLFTSGKADAIGEKYHCSDLDKAQINTYIYDKNLHINFVTLFGLYLSEDGATVSQQRVIQALAWDVQMETHKSKFDCFEYQDLLFSMDAVFNRLDRVHDVFLYQELFSEEEFNLLSEYLQLYMEGTTTPEGIEIEGIRSLYEKSIYYFAFFGVEAKDNSPIPNS